MLPAFPVVFIHTVLDRVDRVFVNQIQQVSNLFGRSTFSTVGTFKLRIVINAFLIVKFGSGTVHSDCHVLARFVSGSFDGGHNRSQSIFRTVQSRSETAFVANSSAQTSVVQYFLQCVEYFSTHTQAFTEALRTYRADHEFLECDRSIGVRTSIDNIHHRNRQYISICSTDITVKRLVEIVGSSFSYSKRYSKHGVCT